MTIRSRHKKFSSQHWLLSICDGSCIIWRVDHSNVTTAGVTNYRNMWRISSTVTKGLDNLWRPSIFRHAVLFVSFVLWRQRDDHFFVTNFFLWQYLPLTWRLRFVIQSQNSCSAAILAAVAVAAAEDPRCALVAQATFWRLGGRSSWWSMVALVSVSIMCHGRGDTSDPQVSFLAFSCSLHYFGPCLNMRYTRNIVALQIWLGQCWWKELGGGTSWFSAGTYHL